MRLNLTLSVSSAFLVAAGMLICPLAVTVAQEAVDASASNVSTDSAAGDDQKVAGRTIDQYQELLGDENRVVRLRAVKSLGAFGKDAGQVLLSALAHDDRAVAYIAAVQLGRIGGDPLQAAVEPLTKLAENKDSLALRMAGSYALCCAGQMDQRLPILIDALSYPDRGTACSAAELIGMLGADAESAIEPLKKVHAANDPAKRNGDYHVGGAAMNALRKVRGE
ncbi:HEAT repeat domain-containing protein [Planctomycetes bacterium K23_9]|uniref:HEAT repeat protein n=1 Tax=Stieleria marina TaxID=1930275 RepID=A0A517P3C0_9BACT|nr:hypothetical protein K239x_59000 [Planctomycetes bacterium K23_9]